MDRIILRRDLYPQVQGVKRKIRRHSNGWNWGYGGSGPADLALNILLRATGDKRAAEQFYQDFKWEVIAEIPWEGAEILLKDIHAWLRQKGYEPNRRKRKRQMKMAAK